jgi:hypothetical protein
MPGLPEVVVCPQKDYHRMYIGEILKVLGRDVTMTG